MLTSENVSYLICTELDSYRSLFLFRYECREEEVVSCDVKPCQWRKRIILFTKTGVTREANLSSTFLNVWFWFPLLLHFHGFVDLYFTRLVYLCHSLRVKSRQTVFVPNDTFFDKIFQHPIHRYHSNDFAFQVVFLGGLSPVSSSPTLRSDPEPLFLPNHRQP